MALAAEGALLHHKSPFTRVFLPDHHALLVIHEGVALKRTGALIAVSHHGRVLYTWPVSTARRGYITPRGNYRPTQLHRMWYSRKYDMSPMPHSVFFSGGYAVHATNYVKRLGTPASHGCVRLHPDDASDFYQLVRTFGRSNTSIVITE